MERGDREVYESGRFIGPEKNKNFCKKNEGGASSRSYRLQKGEPSKILLGGSPPQRLINIEKSLGHRALLM